jgi:hypothetical protein
MRRPLGRSGRLAALTGSERRRPAAATGGQTRCTVSWQRVNSEGRALVDATLFGRSTDDITTLQQRVRELEVALAATQAEQVRPTRRSALRLAGAAVAGGAAAGLLSSTSASATAGEMRFGEDNDAGADDTTLTSSNATRTLQITATNTAANALEGVAVGSGAGVVGRIGTPTALGWGVWGIAGGPLGHGVVAEGGQAQLYLEPGATGPTLLTAHSAGEIAYDGDDVLAACVVTGNPGTWRVLASPSTAGALHPITPTRVYDSRRPLPTGGGPLSSGVVRTISVADGRDLLTGAVTQSDVVPEGATAVAYNVTAINTVAIGFLTINPGGVETISAATVNWTTNGINIGNASVVGISADRTVTVLCGGDLALAHFTIDIVGYYL